MTPKMDDFVSKIVNDPKNPPNTLLLKGYIGASSEEGYIRLYLDSELSDYVEIPEASILYSQEIPKDKSPIGGSYIWIQRDAKVIHGPVVTDRPKASFLEGRIMATTQSCPAEVAAPLALTISGPGCGTIIDGCTDAGPKCPTTVLKTCGDPCTSVGPSCPTKPTICTQSGPSCPTKPGNPSCTQSGPSCPTKPGNATCVDPVCTSNGPNCPTTPVYTCGGPNCQTVSPNVTCVPTACTHSGPNCQTLPGQPGCTSAGIHCPTAACHLTCPAPLCTESGPVCQTRNDPACPFPTEAGKTCVAPCVKP